MIRLPGVRDKGAGLQLGARQPGESGPFGPFGPYGDGDQDDEEHLLDDDQAERATVPDTFRR